MRKKITVFIGLILILAGIASAQWKYNPFTGKFDYYATGSGLGDMLEATWATGGAVKVAKGGTGLTSVLANSYLKGNGTSALVPRTYAEMRTDLALVIGTNVQAYDADLTTYAGITPSANIQALLGSADYDTARTNLGVAIGSNVQAYDADLTTWAGVTPSANGTALVSAANYTAMRDLMDVAPGTDVQAYDADLATLAAPTAWRLFYSNGTSVITQLALGAAGEYLQSNGAAAAPTWVTPAGVGDVVGPGSATDNAVVRFDTTTGKLVQNSVLVVGDTGYLQIPEAAAPGAGAANTARIYAFDKPTSGFTVLNYVDSSGMVRELVRDSVIIVHNNIASTMAAGTAVYHQGTSQDGYPNVAKARADLIATMPAIGITIESIAASAFGRVMQVGMLENVDTSGLTAGDPMYVSAVTEGALTTTPPVTPNLRQEMGAVTIVDPAAGAMQVVARSLSQNDTGTAVNDWIIGSGAVGAKRILFRAGIDGILTWSPTSATKTITLPDATGTVQLNSANLTTISAPTAWRVFYSNGTSVLTELALGADGTYLRSNGAAAAPTFGTPAGAGDFVGPAASTDNAVVRFDLATGKLGQNSVLLVGDTGIMTGGTWQGTVIAPTYGGMGANTVAMTGYPYMTLGVVSQDAVLTKYSTTGIQVNNGANYIRAYHDGTNPTFYTTTGSFIFDTAAGAAVAGIELSDDDTNYVTIQSQEMAADWTMTLPAAVPAANNMPLVGATSGTLSFSAIILPATGTIYKLPVYSAANTITELAAVGATGEYLKGNTGAIPSWATLNQAAVAGLTTADGPTFDHLHLTTDLGVVEGGTGVSTFALNGVLYGNAANAIGVTAIGAAGQILRVGADPFVPAWTTATYPATTTAYRLVASTAANVVGELAASGATGEYLAGVTGTIPAWTALSSITTLSGLTSVSTITTGTWNSLKKQVILDSGNNATVDLTDDSPAACYGQIYTNTGNDSDTHYDLPAAVVGMSMTFYVTVAQTITVDPNGTDQIDVVTGAAGDYYQSDAVIGSMVAFVCVTANHWQMVGKNGTWTEE